MHDSSYEGYQDGTSWISVYGWAWDSRQPNDPVHVEIYDGNDLLATVAADRIRKDLRRAGKGNGRHGFVYPLRSHLHGWGTHQITVRIAHTRIILRDPQTGLIPRAVTRWDRPPPIPDFSKPPYKLWFYYTFLKAVLSPFPRPIWRVPAALLCTLRVAGGVDSRRLTIALLDALGLSTTRFQRWRLQWLRSYYEHAGQILRPQARGYTRGWVRRQIDSTGVNLPPGGAVLIAPHHALGSEGLLVLATMVDHLVLVSSEPKEIDLLADETLRLLWQHMRVAREHVAQMTVLTQEEAGRTGLRLLRAGAFLVLFADAFERGEGTHQLLGRNVSVYRGAAWFAQRSGKPMIPWTVMPHRLGWRLWIGHAVPPTEEGIVQGLEACIRMTPHSWARRPAMMWLQAPESAPESPRPAAMKPKTSRSLSVNSGKARGGSMGRMLAKYWIKR